MTKTIRITTKSNSYARKFEILDGLGAEITHNGGKNVIAKIHLSDIAKAEEILDASYQVSAYKVED